MLPVYLFEIYGTKYCHCQQYLRVIDQVVILAHVTLEWTWLRIVFRPGILHLRFGRAEFSIYNLERFMLWQSSQNPTHLYRCFLFIFCPFPILIYLFISYIYRDEASIQRILKIRDILKYSEDLIKQPWMKTSHH